MFQVVFCPYTKILTIYLHVRIALGFHNSFPWLNPIQAYFIIFCLENSEKGTNLHALREKRCILKCNFRCFTMTSKRFLLGSICKSYDTQKASIFRSIDSESARHSNLVGSNALERNCFENWQQWRHSF
jgi:hypothetical protein